LDFEGQRERSKRKDRNLHFSNEFGNVPTRQKLDIWEPCLQGRENPIDVVTEQENLLFFSCKKNNNNTKTKKTSIRFDYVAHWEGEFFFPPFFLFLFLVNLSLFSQLCGIFIFFLFLSFCLLLKLSQPSELVTSVVQKLMESKSISFPLGGLLSCSPLFSLLFFFFDFDFFSQLVFMFVEQIFMVIARFVERRKGNKIGEMQKKMSNHFIPKNRKRKRKRKKKKMDRQTKRGKGQNLVKMRACVFLNEERKGREGKTPKRRRRKTQKRKKGEKTTTKKLRTRSHKVLLVFLKTRSPVMPLLDRSRAFENLREGLRVNLARRGRADGHDRRELLLQHSRIFFIPTFKGFPRARPKGNPASECCWFAERGVRGDFDAHLERG